MHGLALWFCDFAQGNTWRFTSKAICLLKKVLKHISFERWKCPALSGPPQSQNIRVSHISNYVANFSSSCFSTYTSKTVSFPSFESLQKNEWSPWLCLLPRDTIAFVNLPNQARGDCFQPIYTLFVSLVEPNPSGPNKHFLHQIGVPPKVGKREKDLHCVHLCYWGKCFPIINNQCNTYGCIGQEYHLMAAMKAAKQSPRV